MRILILTKMYPSTDSPGSGAFVRARAKALKARGNRVIVLRTSFHRSDGFGLLPSFPEVEEGVPDYRVHGFRYPFQDRRTLPFSSIRRLVKREEIELLHIHGGDLAEFGARIRRECGIPFIVTLHGSDIHTRPLENPGFGRRLLSAMHDADRVIFVSDYLLSAARGLGFNGDKARVIRNGIDRSVFGGDSACIRDCVGFVGSLSEQKRVMVLPAMFARIGEAIPSLRFAVIGDGPLRGNLASAFSRSGLDGKVEMTGSISQNEVAERMRSMSVLVLPSMRESWGCVVKEAQASGAMVVGSANGGIPEAIGTGGICLPDGDNVAGDFANAVIRLLRNPIPPQDLAEACRGFDWSDTVAEEIQEMEAVLGSYSPRQASGRQE